MRSFAGALEKRKAEIHLHRFMFINKVQCYFEVWIWFLKPSVCRWFISQLRFRSSCWSCCWFEAWRCPVLPRASSFTFIPTWPAYRTLRYQERETFVCFRFLFFEKKMPSWCSLWLGAGVDRCRHTDIFLLCHLPWCYDIARELQQVQVQLLQVCGNSLYNIFTICVTLVVSFFFVFVCFLETACCSDAWTAVPVSCRALPSFLCWGSWHRSRAWPSQMWLSQVMLGVKGHRLNILHRVRIDALDCLHMWLVAVSKRFFKIFCVRLKCVSLTCRVLP